ncbi:vasorin-like [Corythoichthys intestinalis]|uniref:vasorin-like n=1 Tax=Corythoichthys intestinalis TaxID=161448 RepID=UPI0025A5A94F|nr:vasorin-like [Corythoichthys intestinalis]XP_061792404.1 vasorin-like [Nerophis lumbriciformis]
MRPPLVLIFLSSSLVTCFECPADCTCPSPGSIFCINRRSNTVPRVPASTLQLFIFQNGINALTQNDFTGLGDLDLLDLSQNELGEVPDGAFKMLSKLKNLDLSSNVITHISKDSFSGLVQLERLYLHQNHIQSIQQDAFEGLEKLLELKLHGNKLTSLPSLNLPRLLLLDLSSNNIPNLDVSDLQTPHLENLRMASLGLISLDEDLLGSLENLHELDISMNQLSEVPQALKKDSLKGLIKLNLASNPLGELRTEDFQKLTGLQELDLSGLNLQGFPQDFFQSFPRLVHLEAAENPFNCWCPMAWFSVWLREKKIDLGRQGDTRCHFPLANAGKMLSVLEHTDFGCPPTTTLLMKSPVGSTPLPQGPTTTETSHTNAIPSLPPPPPPSEQTPDLKTFPLPSEPHASPTSTSGEYVQHICPANICLNGGTCNFDPMGQLGCLCPLGTSGIFCENLNDVPDPPKPSGTEASVEASTILAELDAISSRQVTSTSILLDLHLFIKTRPNIRGIRLTYRNLSGPDRRPIILSVPASYPEYTLRGLRPNCTYSVCASPLGERMTTRSNSSVETGSCTEARTAGVPLTSLEPRVETQSSLTYTLIPAIAALAIVLGLALVAGLIICMRKRRQNKAKMELELGPADPDDSLRVEGIKACPENGEKGPLSHKQIELDHSHTSQPPASLQQNGNLDYEVPLMQGHSPSNNNRSHLKPSYF